MKTQNEHERMARLSFVLALAGLGLLPVDVRAQCVPPPAGIVSWWRAEGDAFDRVGSNHGTVGAGVGFIAGQVGQAFSFTADGQEITVPASASLNVGAGAGLTVEGWINPSQAATQLPLVEWNSAGSPGAHLWISVSFAGFGGPGAIYASLNGSASGIFATGPGVIQAGVWQHVAMTYDLASGQGRLYRNGTLVSSANLNGQAVATSANLYVGARPGGPSFRGGLDEFAVYSRALSSAEILAIYNGGNAGKCAVGLTHLVLNTSDSGPGSLRRTIQNSVAGDTILFAPNVTGVITLTSGELVVDRSLNILGPGPGVLAISGGNAQRVFAVFPDTSIVTLADLTIRDGLAVSPLPLQAAWGGGILNNANLSVSNCVMAANRAAGLNGVVGTSAARNGTDGSPGQGGAIYNRATLRLVNSTFLNNRAQGGSGGNGFDSATLPGTGGNGGLAWGGAVFSDGPLVAVNCTFATNYATGGNGGNGGQHPFFLIYGPAGAGGPAAGAQLVHYSATAGQIVHGTFVGGRADGGTGGLTGNGSQFGPSGDGSGGGLWALQSTLTLFNTLVANNVASPTNNPSRGLNVLGPFTSQGHNFIGTTNASTGWTGTDLVGSNAAPRDPLLGPLADNGGPTLTLSPQSDSPVVDAGDDATLSAPYALATDQRGFARREGSHVDIGAVELTVARLAGISYPRPWLLTNVPGSDTFLAEAVVVVNPVATPGGVPITVTMTYELRDETNGLVTLRSNSVSQVVMPAGAGSAAVSVSLPLAPAGPLDSVNHTYNVVASLAHRVGAGLVRADNTVTGTTNRFLYFNGRLLFGPRALTIARFGLAPTANTPVSGSYVPVTLRQVRIISANVSGLDFTRLIMAGVQLQPNGDAAYAGSALTLSFGAMPPGFVSNVCFVRNTFQFSSAGIAASTITVKLPTGLGYSPGNAAGPVGRVLQSSFPLGITPLDDFLRPIAPSFRWDASPFPYYFCEETKPFWIPANSITWAVNDGQFELTPAGRPLPHVRRPEYTALAALAGPGAVADPDSLLKKSNDRVFEAVELDLSQPVVVRAGPNREALLSTGLRVTGANFVSHFPYSSSIGANVTGNLFINDDLIGFSQLQYGNRSIRVSYQRDCPEAAQCLGTTNGPDTLTFSAEELFLTVDGGLISGGSTIPNPLEWGSITNGVFAQAHTSGFTEGTYHMPGSFLRGDLTALPVDHRPGVLLLSGFAGPGTLNGAERPGTPEYVTNGLANYAGLNFTVGGFGTRSRTTLAGQTLPDYPLSARSKYYVRYGGVSGIHEPVPRSFPTNLTLYGYPFTFSSFGLAYLGNEPQKALSIVNGSIAVPYPSGFTQDFSRMQITCRGQLDSADLPAGGPDHLLQYWGSVIQPLAMSFYGPVNGECDATLARKLGLLVETRASYVPQPMHGVLGFHPNGNLVAPADDFLNLNSRLSLPPNLTLRGPGSESYNFTTVGQAYLNNYDGAISPPDSPAGWLNIAGKIDLPFFEDARVHLHISPRANATNSPVHIMGGWRAPDDTRDQWGWTTPDSQKLHYFNTLTDPLAFDRHNWGYPKDNGVLMPDYRTNTANAFYHPRAQQTWQSFVDFDYPMDWSSVTRAFKSFGGQTNTLLVLKVGSQVKRITPKNAEISFGAEYSGLPKISLGRVLADGVGEATGVFRSLNVQGFVDGAVLQHALEKLDRALNDRFDGFLTDAFSTNAIDPVVEHLCAGILSGETGLGGGQGFRPASGLTGTGLVAFVHQVLNNELQQRLTSAIGSTGAGSVLATMNDIVGEADKVLGVIIEITKRDQNGVRSVAANIMRQLVDNEALQFAAQVLDYEVLFGAMQKIDPTLDEILARALDIQKRVHKVQNEINGGFRDELSDILRDNLQRFLGPIADDLVNWVNNNVPTQTPSSPGPQARFVPAAGCAGPVAEQFRTFARRRMIERLSASPIATGFQVAIKERLQDVNAEIRETLDTVFQQLNETVRDLLSSQLAELDNGISDFVGDVSDVLGGGQIQGYAAINDDGLRKLRLDGKFRMKVPVGSSRVDLQACKLEYSIVSPK